MDQVLAHPEIEAFLQAYPQTQWPAVLRATLLYGISSLKSLQSAGLPINLLDFVHKEEQAKPGVQGIKGKLQDMKSQIEEIDKILTEAPCLPAQQQTQPPRSCSVPRASNQVYPDWWPKDTSVQTKPQTKTKPPQPKARPKTATVDTQGPPLKPAMKTTGTSTALVQPPFRMNYVPRPTVKATKTVAFRGNQQEITEDEPQVVEPQVIEPRVQSSALSGSIKDQRQKWTNERQTVKRQPNWAGDFSDVVKRSPMKSSSGSSEPQDPSRNKYETSSASSISTYHPSEELKAFYRNEHDKIFAEPRPKTLAPREMSLDPAAQVSMSAQLYRLSGSSGESEQMDSFSRS